MFVTLLLLFVNTGPLNAAMANVLPAELRGRGFAINSWRSTCSATRCRRSLIGAVSDRVGLRVAGARDRAAAGAWPGWCCWRAAARCARDLARRRRCRHERLRARAGGRDARSRARRPRWCAATTARQAGRRQQGRRRTGHRGRPRRQRADRRAPARGVPRRRRAVRGAPRRPARAWAGRASGWSIRSTAPATSSAGDAGFVVMIGLVRRRAARGGRGRPPADGQGLRGRRRRAAPGSRTRRPANARRCTRRRCRSRPTSAWSPRSRTARRASTPSSARCRSPTR